MSSSNTKLEVTINGDGVTESQVDKNLSNKYVLVSKLQLKLYNIL